MIDIIRARKNPVVFDTEDRFIFFPNNKVVQRSIVRDALKVRVIVRKDDVQAWEDKITRIDEHYLERVFKFTVVRNPYDRAVSAFCYLKKLGYIPRRYDFATFCREQLRTEGVDVDPHFQEQADGLYHQGKPIVDFIARYESLGRDWQVIAEKIGEPDLSLPHVGKSPKKTRYQLYYDDPTTEIVSELYRYDLNRLGYRYEPYEPTGLADRLQVFLQKFARCR